MKLTETENIIRNKDTKDLTDFELSEKIRIVSKEITQFDSELINLSREIHEVHLKRDKRIVYLSKLRQDLRLKKMKEDDYY